MQVSSLFIIQKKLLGYMNTKIRYTYISLKIDKLYSYDNAQKLPLQIYSDGLAHFCLVTRVIACMGCTFSAISLSRSLLKYILKFNNTLTFSNLALIAHHESSTYPIHCSAILNT